MTTRVEEIAARSASDCWPMSGPHPREDIAYLLAEVKRLESVAEKAHAYRNQFTANAMRHREELTARAESAEALALSLAEALEPFGNGFPARSVAAEEYSTLRERIVDWFGPSDFRKATAALASPALLKLKGGE